MSESRPWELVVAEDLDRLRHLQLHRQRRIVRPIDATHVECEGHTLVNFSSNNYLGLTHHPRIRAAVEQAIARDGFGSAAAPLIIGYTPAHESAEKSIATWKGTEAAVLLPSGYQANLAAIQTLAAIGERVGEERPGAPRAGGVRFLVDKLAHASLIDAIRGSANAGTLSSSASASPASTVTSTAASKHLTKPPVGGTGTADYIPLWTDSTGDLGNSILYQLGTGTTAKVGINLKAPLATLDVNGQTLIRGILEPVTKGYATPTKAFFSNPLDLEASAFNSATQKASMQHFEWVAEPTRNNTSTPGATLNLLFGQDTNTPTETGIVVARSGAFSATTTDVLEPGVTGLSLGSGFGVFGQGNVGVGGTGNTTGVVGSSLTGTGVQGSGGANGVAASGSSFGVTANSPGTAVYGSGVKYGVYGASDGVGVFGSASTGFGFATDSNVQQARSAGGWVKGMAVINAISPPYNIERCFNSTLLPPAATTPPCGFSLAEDSFGIFTLDFGFEVDDRFYSTALMGASFTQGTFLRLLNIEGQNTQLLIYATDNSGNGVGAEYSVLVY